MLLREMVGRREAIRMPTRHSMNIAHAGWRMTGSMSLIVRASITGVSTIQQPPGAGTPRKKCFQ